MGGVRSTAVSVSPTPKDAMDVPSAKYLIYGRMGSGNAKVGREENDKLSGFDSAGRKKARPEPGSMTQRQVAGRYFASIVVVAAICGPGGVGLQAHAIVPETPGANAKPLMDGMNERTLLGATN